MLLKVERLFPPFILEELYVFLCTNFLVGIKKMPNSLITATIGQMWERFMSNLLAVPCPNEDFFRFLEIYISIIFLNPREEKKILIDCTKCTYFLTTCMRAAAQFCFA